MSLRGLWRRIWSPSPRIAAGVLVIGGGTLGVLFWGGFHTAVEFTNNTEFCISCHQMRDTVYPEYQSSIHYKNASGVRAGCTDCHVPRQWFPEMVAKAKALGDLYHTVLGTIDTPEQFEARRLTMAKDVWASMTASDSRECRNCHSFAAMDFHKQRPEAQERMQKAAQDGETCISCHKGIAHHLPDMSQGYKQLWRDLQASAAKTRPRQSDVLYPLTTLPLFVDHPNSKDATPDGRLLAATPVKVLKVDGDWLQVEIPGWQQQGAERMMYAAQGKRIFAAALAPSSVDKVQKGADVTDKDTDQVWAPVTLTAWIANDGLIADEQKLWAYGQEFYGATCGTCHATQPTTHFLANQWIGTLNAMRKRVSIDDEQQRLLQKYLQMHASDMVNKG
jgi:trimethylamine-N-oxide reductase (cytochrome c), cytochrome c-type subunit TorC